jgi:hypothetical protein
VSFRDWSEQQKEEFDEAAFAQVYNNITSVAYFSDEEDENARELFTLGWLTWPMSQEEVQDYREQFFDAIYMPESLFTSLGLWAEYRELYSDVDAG